MPHDHATPGHGCCGGHAHRHHDGATTGHAHVAPDSTPVLVEVTRGNAVESRHRGSACIVDARGRVLRRWGDIEAPVYPRSAIKSLQAIPLVESGAADAFGLGEEELALACASHSGEPVHTERVAAWLARIGLAPDDLECGTHLPYDEPTAHALLRAGQPPTPVHNNCSGKHSGMLATARHKGEDPKGYVRFEHPVQQRILGVLEQMTGLDLSQAPWGVDGCGIPTIGVPLHGIAFAMARIADPSDLPDARRHAVERIRRAWAAHPYLVGGRDSFDTRFMTAAGSRVLLKVGAEGVMCAVLPERGLGAAVKIEDGAARAAGIAMAGILKACDLLPGADWEALDRLTRPAVRNRADRPVGEIRPAVPGPS